VVRLTLYDAAGRMVQDQDLGLLLPGHHTAEIAGSSLPPGLYVYELQAGAWRQTGSLIRVH